MYSNLEYLGSAEGYVEDILDIIDRIKIFADFSVDEVMAMCRYMQCYAAPRDCLLMEDEAEGNFLMLVLSGSVRVEKYMPGGGIQVIGEVKVGGSLGELSLIDGRSRVANCYTNTPTDVAVLTRDALDHIFAHHPRLGNKFLLALLGEMTMRLRETFVNFMPGVSGAPI